MTAVPLSAYARAHNQWVLTLSAWPAHLSVRLATDLAVTMPAPLSSMRQSQFDCTVLCHWTLFHSPGGWRSSWQRPSPLWPSLSPASTVGSFSADLENASVLRSQCGRRSMTETRRSSRSVFQAFPWTAVVATPTTSLEGIDWFVHIATWPHSSTPLPRAQMRGVDYRHTDNINFFLAFLKKVGLPKIFHPSTLDVYERKNLPRLVYCLHCLSHLLECQGMVPQAVEKMQGDIFSGEGGGWR